MRVLNLLHFVVFFISMCVFTLAHGSRLSAYDDLTEHIPSLFDFVEVSDFNYANKNKINETLIIESVLIGSCTNKNSPCFENAQVSEFFALIKLTNTGSLIQNWKFGFYMPRSFNRHGKINNNLTMDICDATHNCQKLKYSKETSVYRKDQSVGYTTVLEPEGDFELKPGSQYEIRLIRNNQWRPNNISAVPQNLFLVVHENNANKIYNLSTNKSSYHIQGYNQKNVDALISDHNIKNWNSSSQTLSNHPIIPSPVSYISSSDEKYFFFTDELGFENAFAGLDPRIENYLNHILVSDLKIAEMTKKFNNINSGIIFKRIKNPNEILHNPEGYKISISENLILVEALHNAGFFYAVQTLRQLWFQADIKSLNQTGLKTATIIDYPRFKYRGIALDLARHFFSVEEIKNFIEIMSVHKLNSLHLHFADDEGFRIQLTDFDSFNKISDSRGYGKNIGPLMFVQGNLDKTNTYRYKYPTAVTQYTKTYTKSEILEIIQFANSHQITVIPEIDLPGHSRALIKAMPNIFYDKNDKSEFMSVQGYTDNVIPVCAYGDKSEFGINFTNRLNKIIYEIADMFSNQSTLYFIKNEISLGGDEVSEDAWNKSSTCQNDWAQLTSLGKSHKFFKEISNKLNNIKISGWQQFVQNDDQSLGSERVQADKTGRVWLWNTTENGILQAVNLANNSYPVVLAFADQTYFDLAYNPDRNEPGFSWATQFSDTESALRSSLSSKITQEMTYYPENILGIEGTLWSENLPTYAHLTYMALPKMTGLAEASWASVTFTTEANLKTNWQSLIHRLGCGEKGFLSFIYNVYNVKYRGYPTGISLEAPREFCNL
ncbi:family 20 glycosylhydrolase [Fluviispira sanaruensis]|uniref:beta-N-acetylhexosaminidase n=1 Tax=Fluviispira sanaruensis TaxID=2493639 RepID=A0A4P2VM11_FLUSA|nr:family 20 glycosylhydrolase [Fluviispira sanaruensis]BBH54396.1 hypothetical protein JCM31447_28610 [Fluviispira sanaruensis]